MVTVGNKQPKFYAAPHEDLLASAADFISAR